jgi:hypothetical protein
MRSQRPSRTMLGKAESFKSKAMVTVKMLMLLLLTQDGGRCGD